MLVPWFDVDDAFAEMNSLAKQMDALLGNRGLDGRHGLRSFERPIAGLVETADAWSWSIDLPGLRKDSVSVTIENGALVINAKREPTPPIEGATPRYLERRPYEVSHNISLPDTVDVDRISASFEHGVLTLQLPKREHARPRQIEVQVRQG
jgi:HSP20 family protein